MISMAYLIAQVSDIHIGGPAAGSGDRFSAALNEINAMIRKPDLVLLTGDLTHHGSAEEWNELRDRLEALTVPWEAIPGNHDQGIAEIAGHRSITAGPVRLVLVDSAREIFDAEDAAWLDEELGVESDRPTVIAIHHPPFETGIWWMDRVGMTGLELFEATVRRHPQVAQVLSGHVHRALTTRWGTCSLWVCPSTAVTVALDLDRADGPAETAEGPAFSLHAYTSSVDGGTDVGIVSHVVPVGPAAARTSIEGTAPEFVSWVRSVQADHEESGRTRPEHPRRSGHEAQ